jgi:dTDP-4-dehydrorhamnose 3,5-epimerase-like enzyme
MAKLIKLNTFNEERGSLTVLDNILPFDIKRVFYIYGVDSSVRGGHRHHNTTQAAICIVGSCTIYSNDSETESVFELDSPEKCLIIESKDWHTMYNFSRDAILLVFASSNYNFEDYIYEPY